MLRCFKKNTFSRNERLDGLSARFMQSSLSSPFLLGARHFQVLRGRCTVAWQVVVGVSLGRAVRPTIPLWARDGGYELISSFFREL